jgi:hypothetical protein
MVGADRSFFHNIFHLKPFMELPCGWVLGYITIAFEGLHLLGL